MLAFAFARHPAYSLLLVCQSCASACKELLGTSRTVTGNHGSCVLLQALLSCWGATMLSARAHTASNYTARMAFNLASDMPKMNITEKFLFVSIPLQQAWLVMVKQSRNQDRVLLHTFAGKLCNLQTNHYMQSTLSAFNYNGQ